MILVLLGTQNNQFTRILEEIEKQIEKENIKEEVIVQAGCTKYKTKEEKIKIVDYMTIEEFNKNLEKAKIIITHAGVGTILQALENVVTFTNVAIGDVTYNDLYELGFVGKADSKQKREKNQAQKAQINKNLHLFRWRFLFLH